VSFIAISSYSFVRVFLFVGDYASVALVSPVEPFGHRLQYD
jgi:hypothetical protein